MIQNFGTYTKKIFYKKNQEKGSMLSLQLLGQSTDSFLKVALGNSNFQGMKPLKILINTHFRLVDQLFFLRVPLGLNQRFRWSQGCFGHLVKFCAYLVINLVIVVILGHVSPFLLNWDDPIFMVIVWAFSYFGEIWG